MPLHDAFRQNRPAVALEITPPRTAAPRTLLRRAGLLGAGVDAVNVIQRGDRQSSLDAALQLHAAGVSPVWHIANRGADRAGLIRAIERAAAGGVRQTLCLRGDHTAQDTDNTPSIHEVVALLHERIPEATVGVTLNQYAADQGAALRNLRAKLSRGAAYVQTQPVFDAEAARPLIERVKQASPETRILPMVMPLLSAEAATALAARLRIRLPDRLTRALADAGEEAGWSAFGETLAELAGAVWASGVAVMTFGMDPPPEHGTRIRDHLRAAGLLATPDSALPSL